MNRDELRRILDAHLEWLVFDGERGARADLRGADLSGMDLEDLVLTGALMAGAKLTGATLHRARMDGADLTNADMRKVLASDTRFDDAIMPGADLTGAFIEWSDFRRVDVRWAKLRNVNADGTDFSGAQMDGSDFSYATLSKAVLSDTRLIDVVGIYDAGLNRRGDRFVGVDHGDHAMIAVANHWCESGQMLWLMDEVGDRDGLRRVRKIEAWHNELKSSRSR